MISSPCGWLREREPVVVKHNTRKDVRIHYDLLFALAVFSFFLGKKGIKEKVGSFANRIRWDLEQSLSPSGQLAHFYIVFSSFDWVFLHAHLIDNLISYTVWSVGGLFFFSQDITCLDDESFWGGKIEGGRSFYS